MHEIIHNVETGEVIERELTPEEVAAYEAFSAKIAEEADLLNAKQLEKEAIAARLGLSTDELKTLLS